MKKKIFGGIAVATIAAAMALNLNFNAKNNYLSDITLANVEALAGGEVSVDWICRLTSNAECVNDPDFGQVYGEKVAK